MHKKKLASFLLIIIFIMFLVMTYTQVQKYNYGKNLKLIREVTAENQQLLNELVDIAINSPAKYIEELTLKLKSETNDIKIGIYNEAIGRAYVKIGNKENWNKYLSKALKVYESSKHGEKFQFKLNLFLVQLYIMEGDYTKSTEYCYKILDIINNKENKNISDEDMAEARVLMSATSLGIFLEDKFKEQARVHYDKIVEINAESNIYIENKDILLYSKYLYEMEIGDEFKAKNTIEELYDMANKNEIKSELLCKEGIQLSVINSKIKTIDKSKFIGEMDGILKKFQANKDNYYLGMSYLAYGDYYEMRNKYAEAKVKYDKAIKYFEAIGYKRGITKSCEKIIKIYEGKKRVVDIGKYYTKYFKYSREMEETNTLKLLIKALVYINGDLRLINTNSLTKENFAIVNKNNHMKKVSFILAIIIVTMVILIYKLHNQILKRIKREEQLKASLNIDHLTQSYTKAYGYEIIEKLMKEKKSFYLSIIDLDDFKVINDTYGHIFGDMVLSDIAINIKRSLDKDDFLVRFGGEEFILVMVNKACSEAKDKLEEIRVKVEGMKWEDDLKTTISIGAAKYIDNDLKSFLEGVDELLYRAKNSGKNKIEMM